MLYVCLCLSGLLLLIVNVVALRPGKPRVGLATLLSAAAVVPLIVAGFLLPIANAILVALAGAVCYQLKVRPRWFLISSLGVTALAYGVGAAVGVREVREWEGLESRYPMISLAPRLAYETRPRRNADANSCDAARLSALEARLGQQEEKYHHTRERSLELLHAGSVAQFVNSWGFGRIWTGDRLSPEDLAANDMLLDLVLLNDRRQPSPPYPPEPEAGPVKADAAPELLDPHGQNYVSFLEPSDYGYVRDREHVAGFRPHQFLLFPVAPRPWRVGRLELVSLLKFDDPAVYVSDNLPALNELRDAAATRPLDPFESEALAGLRRGEDLMVQERPDRMRMLGSVRAVRQCLRCHHGERGDLLGAFSYRLTPDR
ncbi:MAG TPA: hypothetical protein VFW33_07290 [Gemmataceae bacterium]|nr:hypothetical protein [Gemmataceae bacterium]